MFRRLTRLLTHQSANEDGFALIMVAVCMPALLGIAALLVDVGHAYSEKRHLQNAADAAALAASSYLPSTDLSVLTQAQNAAVDFAARNGVTITTADVTFTSTSVENDTAHVTTRSMLPTSFAQAIGISTTAVRATGGAALGSMVGAIGVMPWGMTPPQPDGFVFGQEYCMKLAAVGTCNTGRPSDFQIMDVDDTGNSGASYYSGLIVSGSATIVRAGEVKNIITGNKAGPTDQGVGCTGNSGRITDNTQTFSDVIQANAGGGYTVLDWSSPRLALIPVIQTVDDFRVLVTGFAVFFIDDCGPNASVVGRFIDTVVPKGIWGPYYAGADYGTRSIRLVE